VIWALLVGKETVVDGSLVGSTVKASSVVACPSVVISSALVTSTLVVDEEANSVVLGRAVDTFVVPVVSDPVVLRWVVGAVGCAVEGARLEGSKVTGASVVLSGVVSPPVVTASAVVEKKDELCSSVVGGTVSCSVVGSSESVVMMITVDFSLVVGPTVVIVVKAVEVGSSTVGSPDVGSTVSGIDEGSTVDSNMVLASIVGPIVVDT
jgi:hypothetical protein